MTVANLMEILLTLPQSDIISVDGKKIIGAKDSSCVGMSEILTKECSEEELWGLANIEKSECEKYRKQKDYENVFHTQKMIVNNFGEEGGKIV